MIINPRCAQGSLVRSEFEFSLSVYLAQVLPRHWLQASVWPEVGIFLVDQSAVGIGSGYSIVI